VVFVVGMWWFSCGLAALAMAGQLLTGSLLDADHLLQRAVERRFSFRGEIFSGVMHILTRFSFYILYVFLPAHFIPCII